MTDLQASMLIITLNVIEERIQKKKKKEYKKILNFHFKELGNKNKWKLNNNRRKGNNKISNFSRSEINKIENKKMFKNYETKNMFFGTINKIDKPLTQNDWDEGDTITNMTYETSDIITDTTDNKKMIKNY